MLIWEVNYAIFRLQRDFPPGVGGVVTLSGGGDPAAGAALRPPGELLRNHQPQVIDQP